MTEAEALDMAAKAAGWADWADACVSASRRRLTLMENAALKAENERLREALGEISRRTGLLIHQNTGRWKMNIEHDKRTVDVLTANQRIASAALERIDNGDR